MNDQLKPCPFCGKQPTYDDYGIDGKFYYCDNEICVIAGVLFTIERWNTRHSDPVADDIAYADDLAKNCAFLSKFKSDFPHDEQSVYYGFMMGFKANCPVQQQPSAPKPADGRWLRNLWSGTMRFSRTMNRQRII